MALSTPTPRNAAAPMIRGATATASSAPDANAGKQVSLVDSGRQGIEGERDEGEAEEDREPVGADQETDADEQTDGNEQTGAQRHGGNAGDDEGVVRPRAAAREDRGERTPDPRGPTR